MYEAPQITGQRELSASLITPSDFNDASDADIKHGTRPVTGYEAPQITDERELSGSTQLNSLNWVE